MHTTRRKKINQKIVNERGTELNLYKIIICETWAKKHKSGFYTRVCKQNENVEKKIILE